MLLPVEIVLAPDWWHAHTGMCFDRDFFFHPVRRVEAERKMEQVLYERWGNFGLGRDRDRDLPLVGATHLAAGYLLSEMLGCHVEYCDNRPPTVHPAGREELSIDEETAFRSDAFRRFEKLIDDLKTRHGYLVGDTNWGGVLNLGMDLHGQMLLSDMIEQPEQVASFFGQLGRVIDRFVGMVERETGSSSISVNRNVLHFSEPIFLHSECSLTMISVSHYERFLLPLDLAWSECRRPFGIHYCGLDPHRFAASFAKIPHLDFLDVGWGGNLKVLRAALPNTFLNIRLSPVEIVRLTPEEIAGTVRRLVADAGGPAQAGVCCINIDRNVTDEQIAAIFRTVEELKKEAN
ncbi:MAG: hypothetical protein IT426_13100 [Pirellulales bacterium]|nr:hypothetical protein [Pirellulales bacterium]